MKPDRSVDALHNERRAVVVCDQWLGSNGYAGMKALRRAGWLVQVVPEWRFIPVHWRSSHMRVLGRLLRPAAVREFNNELLRTVRHLRPELLLVFKGMFVRAETLAATRAMGVRAYCFYPDVSFRTHGPNLPAALQQYDWVFSTKTFGLRDMREQLGVSRSSLLRHAYDRDLHRPVELYGGDHSQYDCDVSFIGTWSPKKETLLTMLSDQHPRLKLRVWGNQWGRVTRRSSLQHSLEHRAVDGEEYVRAIAGSKINLAILSEQRTGASSGDLLTSRSFHIPACGGFMLHERTVELSDVLTENESVACFSDADEMMGQINRYVADDAARTAIAARGHQVIAAAHSWDDRIREILAHHEAGVAS